MSSAAALTSLIEYRNGRHVQRILADVSQVTPAQSWKELTIPAVRPLGYPTITSMLSNYLVQCSPFVEEQRHRMAALL
jgi:hypothetical protein